MNAHDAGTYEQLSATAATTRRGGRFVVPATVPALSRHRPFADPGSLHVQHRVYKLSVTSPVVAVTLDA